MQDDSPLQKSNVKKSSFQLEEEQQMPQQQSKQPTQTYPELSAETHLLDNQVEDQNLLDLNHQTLNKEQHFEFLKDRIVVIDGTELVTENVIKSYKLYRIKSRKKKQDNFDTIVSRRFSDFQYLQKQLIENYGGYIIPLLPQKNFWVNVNMEGEEYMHKRTKDLEKYLRSLLAHQKLRMTIEVKNFLFSDEAKFSQEKGEFFSKIKTQQKLYEIAESAYNYSKVLFSKFLSGSEVRQVEPMGFMKPSIEDLKLLEYERDVGDLVKILNVLRNLVENTATQMRVIQNLQKKQNENKSPANYEKLLQQFQDLCKYIISCNEALKRRHELRKKIDEFNREYESIQKKIKSNPRSQQVDILRNKLAKATQKCHKWTESLLGQLEKSVTLGKSMVEQFAVFYTQMKEQFYQN